jgi:hypothetical protein
LQIAVSGSEEPIPAVKTLAGDIIRQNQRQQKKANSGSLCPKPRHAVVPVDMSPSGQP